MNLDTLDVESARFDILTTGVRPISRNAMPGRKWLADPGFQLGAPVPLRLTSKFRLVFASVAQMNVLHARPTTRRVCVCMLLRACASNTNPKSKRGRTSTQSRDAG